MTPGHSWTSLVMQLFRPRAQGLGCSPGSPHSAFVAAWALPGGWQEPPTAPSLDVPTNAFLRWCLCVWSITPLLTCSVPTFLLCRRPCWQLCFSLPCWFPVILLIVSQTSILSLDFCPMSIHLASSTYHAAFNTIYNLIPPVWMSLLNSSLIHRTFRVTSTLGWSTGILKSCQKHASWFFLPKHAIPVLGTVSNCSDQKSYNHLTPLFDWHTIQETTVGSTFKIFLEYTAPWLAPPWSILHHLLPQLP